MQPSADPELHRQFLNRSYGAARYIYDITRKYYLFGRDTALEQLLQSPWSTLIEVGPGTGRNLLKLHELDPERQLGGVEASDAMLEFARKRCNFATIHQGFAETADYAAVLGTPPERILFSYSLSMMSDPEGAIRQARQSLSPNGEVWVVDFSDFSTMPALSARALKKWLASFGVAPLNPDWLQHQGGELSHGPGHYFVIARFLSPN